MTDDECRLLPCPMCGSKAELNIDCDVYVACTKCGISGSHRAATTGSADTYQILPVEEVNERSLDLIAEWNTRTKPEGVDIEAEKLIKFAALIRSRKGWAQTMTKIHGDSISADFETAAKYLEYAATKLVCPVTVDTEAGAKAIYDILFSLDKKFGPVIDNHLDLFEAAEACASAWNLTAKE